MTANIIVVDDMPDNRMLLEALLTPEHSVTLAESGKQCLEIVSQNKPDLILLDLLMPEMDGFEVCEHLKDDFDSREIPIIFITSSTCDDEKLKAYELGADDFINKPFNHDELNAKVSKTLAGTNRLKDANEMAMAAQQAAMIAMTNSSELGIILKFMEQAGECDSFEALATKLDEVCQNFGLICCFQFSYESQVVNIGHGCVDGSLEAKMITEAKKVGGIIGHGKRMFFNQPHISMLVKNMPVEDDDKCGRYKDNLAVLISSANGVARTIGMEGVMAQQRKDLIKSTFDLTFERTNHVMAQVNRLETTTIEIVQEIRFSFEEALFSLGLSEEQESYLLGIFDSAMDKMDAVKETANSVEDAMRHVVQDFEMLLAD